MHMTFDLETLGVNANSPIVQIAAVVFSSQGTIYDEIQLTINLESLQDFDFTVDYSTISWWMNQTKKAQKSVFGVKHKDDIEAALIRFKEWMIQATTDYPDIKIWSHKDFDPVILQNAYNKIGITTPPWYRRHVDIRTLTHLAGPISVKREGVHHNALDDCKYQAKYIAKSLKQMNKARIKVIVEK